MKTNFSELAPKSLKIRPRDYKMTLSGTRMWATRASLVSQRTGGEYSRVVRLKTKILVNSEPRNLY